MSTSWVRRLYPCARCKVPGKSGILLRLSQPVYIQRKDGRWSGPLSTVCLCATCAEEWSDRMPPWIRRASVRLDRLLSRPVKQTVAARPDRSE